MICSEKKSMMPDRYFDPQESLMEEAKPMARR